MTWSEFGFFLLSSVIGGGIVKMLDILVSGFNARKTHTNSKVATLLAHIKDYQELADLYGFLARYDSHAVRDESGDFKRDTEGNLIFETKSFEPEPRFEEALKEMTGTDFNAAIANKIVTIRQAATEATDIAYELDKSGNLKKQFYNLYAKTVSSIELILKEKNSQNQAIKFGEMIVAMNAADEARQKLRADVQRYLN